MVILERSGIYFLLVKMFYNENVLIYYLWVCVYNFFFLKNKDSGGKEEKGILFMPSNC